MKEQAEKAFAEMLEISTDVDKAVLFAGDQVVVSNFPESLQGTMVKKAHELAVAGAARAADMGSAPLTQLVAETGGGMVFLVQEPEAAGMGILATAKKDSRIGLVFYDMKTCIRDAQEIDDAGSAGVEIVEEAVFEDEIVEMTDDPGVEA